VFFLTKKHCLGSVFPYEKTNKEALLLNSPYINKDTALPFRPTSKYGNKGPYCKKDTTVLEGTVEYVFRAKKSGLVCFQLVEHPGYEFFIKAVSGQFLFCRGNLPVYNPALNALMSQTQA